MRPGIDLVMVTVLALISALGAGPAGGDGKADQPAGLALARPYSRGKIPVILIHGLGSSPKSWAPMIEALEADPSLRPVVAGHRRERLSTHHAEQEGRSRSLKIHHQ